MEPLLVVVSDELGISLLTLLDRLLFDPRWFDPAVAALGCMAKGRECHFWVDRVEHYCYFTSILVEYM